MMRLWKILKKYWQRRKYKTLAHIHLVGNQIRVEASSKCQLKCPLCLTGTHYHRKHSVVGWGHLSFENFKRLIEQNPSIKHIELSNNGELFLNPALLKIMAYAHEHNIRLSAINGVNLNDVKEEVLEGLVKYQFFKLKVSIDGASQATYQQYRVGGDFNQVIANIKKINAYKQQYKSRYPKLKWQFIIFGHNEHELPLAKQMAKKLNMGFKAKLNYSPKKFPIKNAAFVKKETGLSAAYIDEYEKEKKQLYSPACLQLWTAPQVNWDGKLLGCCVNHFGDFGNVFEEGLSSLLQSEKYLYAKQMVLGEQPTRADIPCTQCKRLKRVVKTDLRKQLIEVIEKT